MGRPRSFSLFRRTAVVLALVCGGALGAQSSDVRFALVIGNSGYQSLGRLANPINDAQDVAQALKGQGFSVTLVTDGTRRQMNQALNDFHDRLAAAPTAAGVFWFAGHGIQSKDENYLIPVGAEVKRESDLEDEAVSVRKVMNLLDDARNRVNLVVLDACRNNPLVAQTRSTVRGLKAVAAAPQESIVLYSTGVGKEAQDGSGRNSPFAQAFLKYLGQPGDILVTIKAVIAETKRLTGGEQVPYQYSSLTVDFSLARGAGGPSFGAVTPAVGALTVTLASAGTLTVAGRSFVLPAGGSLPVTNLAPGDYPLTVTYADGRTENQTATVAGGQTLAVGFGYIQAPIPIRVTEGFVAVTGGTFTMGSASNEPGRSKDEARHMVSVSSFLMSATEVTQGQWKAVMGSNPSQFPGDRQPVESVNWYDAVAYCNKLSQKEGLTPAYVIDGVTVTWNRGANGYRLPTEAEWEYAALGGLRGLRTPYSGTANPLAVGWVKDNSNGQPHPVGLKPANELGLFDLTGNVWEWCWDWYSDYPATASVDPSGSSTGTYRVYRGGSWILNPLESRIANRENDTPNSRYSSLGFRIVRNLRP